jgi:hypothetical protein
VESVSVTRAISWERFLFWIGVRFIVVEIKQILLIVVQQSFIFVAPIGINIRLVIVWLERQVWHN